MKLRNIISLLVLIYAAKSIAADCHIKTWDKVFYFSKNEIKSSDVIKETNCDDKTQLQFIKSLVDFEGTISASYLKDDLPNVEVAPAKITIDSLSNALNRKLEMSNDIRWSDLKSSNNRVITMDAIESFTADLTSRSLGKKSVKVTVTNPISGQDKTYWITGVLETKVKGLAARNHLSSTFTELSKKQFVATEVYTSYPERLFTDIKRIVHYRLNRPLTRGQVLKKSDISSLPLVQIGVPATITLQSKGIQLNGKALPMRMGKFGEVIQLKTLNSKKTLTGRVVDFNKVVIEL